MYPLNLVGAALVFGRYNSLLIGDHSAKLSGVHEVSPVEGIEQDAAVAGTSTPSSESLSDQRGEYPTNLSATSLGDNPLNMRVISSGRDTCTNILRFPLNTTPTDI